ncbi:MAG: YjbE family putative metal transport protein [Alphaproteobacteria bacterium]|jgi:YjbE family integral membrane protein
MFDPETLSQITALLTVIGIDIVLAGDNAVVVAMAAAGLSKELRAKAIMIGIVAAMLMRIIFALVAAELLSIVGLLALGGVLLLWVAWKLWRELRDHQPNLNDTQLSNPSDEEQTDLAGKKLPQKTLRQAVIQILVADLTMSLDNVLAVAGAAHDHPYIMAFGLFLSVALMGLAATWIARLLERNRWIAYVGLLLILYVALRMIWDGGIAILQVI